MFGGPFTSQPAAAAAQKGIQRRTLEALYPKVQLQESPYIHLRWRMECYKKDHACAQELGNKQDKKDPKRNRRIAGGVVTCKRRYSQVSQYLIGRMLAGKGRLDETEKQI